MITTVRNQRKIYKRSESPTSSLDHKSLQQVVWFNIMFHLIRRGRENLRLLIKEWFAVRVDAAGKKFVYQVLDSELDKSHGGGGGDEYQPDDSV